MNDIEGKMAITEKKPHSVGGCKGIFFQLFDWNKRLARKKLFSKKLLPAVHSKQSLKKFGSDDKQPKLCLIADENKRGMPIVKKLDSDKKNETRAPSLIAKLMGLDSMPAMQKSKSRKGFSGNGRGRTDKLVHECKKLETEELILEQVDAKNEWMPQKSQKTGLPDRRPAAKLGADQLQIKAVLSRSRKHQLPKLGSPVKSPRSSGRNASRLIGVATRILEPGLQKSRGIYALTYSNNSNCHSNYESMMDERTHTPPELLNSSSYCTSPASMIPKGQSPCTNCGLTLDRLGSESTTVQRSSKPVSPVSHFVDFYCQGYETSQPRIFLSYPGMEGKKDESQFGSASQLNTLKCSNPTANRKPLNKEIQVNLGMTSQQCNSQKDLKQNTQMQNQMLQAKGRKYVNSKLRSVQWGRVAVDASVLRETKIFAPFGQSFSVHARDSEAAKVDDWKYGIRRKDETSSVQKKRPTNFHKKYESLGPASDLGAQLRTGSEVISEKEARFNALSRNCRLSESTLTKSGDQRRTGSGVKKANMDSFTFRSSVKCITQSHSGTEYSEVQKNSSFENSCEDGQSIGVPGPLSMSGDALSTLLEQKLQELTSQGDDDSAKGGNAPKKTTAMILQELISALTTEQHYHNHSVGQSNSELDLCYNHHCLSSADTSFRFKAQNASSPTSVRHENDDSRRLSPGSVLEAYFSIDSCSSSNLDDVTIKQNKRVFETTSCFNSEQNTWEPDADLLEATISQRLQPSGQTVNRLLNNVTDILCNISVTETSLVGSKLNHAKGVILDAELMLANKGFPILQYMFTELETLETIIRMSFSYTHSWSQVKGFAFDSIVQYLDSRYTRYSKCGFSAWSRLPLPMDSEMVILEIIEEIRRWTELAGMIHVDLIEWDMSHSLGKWTDFEVEAFETGIELDQYILETLVDELVIDLCKC